MRSILLGIYIVAALVLQSTFFNYIKLFGVKPDLLLVFAIIYALHDKDNRGGIFGFFVGLIEDLVVGRYIGINGLTKGIVCQLISYMEQKIYKENIMIPIFLVFGATVFHDFIYYLIRSIIDMNISLYSAFWGIILPTALYNSILVPIIYPKLHKSFTKGLLSQNK